MDHLRLPVCDRKQPDLVWDRSVAAPGFVKLFAQPSAGRVDRTVVGTLSIIDEGSLLQRRSDTVGPCKLRSYTE